MHRTAIDWPSPDIQTQENIDSMNKTPQKFALVATILMMTACAGVTKTPVETLEQRVQGRWDAVISGDYQTAYQYMSPGQREVVSYEMYLKSVFARTVRWTGGEFREVVGCEESACKVRTAITYEVSGLTPGQGRFSSVRAVIEDWIQIDGVWYFVPPR
jgi:hypothetical protein